MEAIVNVFHRLAADGYENFTTQFSKLPSGAVQLIRTLAELEAIGQFLGWQTDASQAAFGGGFKAVGVGAGLGFGGSIGG